MNNKPHQQLFKLNLNKKLCSSTNHKNNIKNILCLCCDSVASTNNNNKFPSFWLELRKQKQFCDGIVILPSGNQYKVHRIVLSACSSYFKASFIYNNTTTTTMTDQLSKSEQTDQTSSKLLSSSSTIASSLSVDNQNEQIIIHLDVCDNIMEDILDFAYTGNCNVNWPNVEDLLAAADRYELIGLIQLCCKFLMKEITVENCIGIYLYAKHYFCTELEIFARNFILRNFTKISKESKYNDSNSSMNEFKLLDAIELQSILSDEKLNVDTEEIVFDAIKQWVQVDAKIRAEHLKNLIPCVRLGLIGQDFFKEHMLKWSKKYLDFEKIVLPISCRPRIPNQIIFVIGGWTEGSPTNIIEIYDPRADLWLNMRFTDATRAYHGVCTIDQKVYVLGGFDGFTHYNSVRCYDPITYKWEERACMYTPKCYVSVAVLGRKIYAIGGYNGHNRLNTVERYDIDKNQWELLTPMMRSRSDAGAAILDNNIYVVGGFNGNEVLRTCEMYNPVKDCWIPIPPMLNPRSGVGVVVCNDKLYAIGGFSGVERLNSVETFSVQDPKWRYVADMLIPRSNFATVVIDKVIYVIGGFNGAHTIGSVEKYDPKTNLWQSVAQMNFSRSAQSACVLKDLPNIKEYSMQCRDMTSTSSPCFLKTFYDTNIIEFNNRNNQINNTNNNNDFSIIGEPIPYNGDNVEFNPLEGDYDEIESIHTDDIDLENFYWDDEQRNNYLEYFYNP